MVNEERYLQVGHPSSRTVPNLGSEVPLFYVQNTTMHHWQCMLLLPVTLSAFIFGFVTLANVFYWLAFPLCADRTVGDLFQCLLLCTLFIGLVLFLLSRVHSNGCVPLPDSHQIKMCLYQDSVR